VAQDVQTKSSDFLPGKPNLDGLNTSISGNNQVNLKAPTDSSVPPANASAHIIDLKNTSESPANSPLFDEMDKEKADTVTTDTVKPQPISVKPDTTVKVALDEVKSAEPESKSELTPSTPTEVKPELEPTPITLEPIATPEPDKQVNDLNLASKDEMASSDADKPAKKGSKLKIVLIVVVAIVVVAIITVAVILILRSTNTPV